MPGQPSKKESLSSLLKKRAGSLSGKELRRVATRQSKDAESGGSSARKAPEQTGTSKENDHVLQVESLHSKGASSRNSRHNHHHYHAHSLIFKAKQRYHHAEQTKKKPELAELAPVSSSSSISIQTEDTAGSIDTSGDASNLGSSNAKSSSADSSSEDKLAGAIRHMKNVSLRTTNGSSPGAGTFVQALCSRIERSLPLKSGLSLEQLDVDPSFTEAKRHLIVFASRGFLDATLRELQGLLEKILKAAGADLSAITRSFDQMSYPSSFDTSSSASINASSPVAHLTANLPLKSPLAGFSVPVLRSLDVVLGLISSLAFASWDTVVTKVPANTKIYRDYGIQGFPSQKNGAIYFTTTPKQLEPEVANSLLALLPRLRSDNDIIHNLRSITESPTTESIVNSLERPQVKHAGNSAAQKSEADLLVASIDSHVSKICSYVASANPGETYDYLRLKFANISIESLYLPSVDIVGLLHLDKESLIAYLGLVSAVLKVSRRQSQTALLLSYLADSIVRWSIYRTEDFLQTQKDPKVAKIVGPLFDSLFKSMDFKFYHRASFKVLSTLLLFLPDEIKAAGAKEGAIRKASFSLKRPAIFKSVDSKQTFIANLHNVLREKPGTGCSLTRFLGIGCVFALYDEHNPIAGFAKTVFENVSHDISSLARGTLDIHEFMLPSDLIQSLQRDRFAMSMMTNPEATAERVIELCQETPRDYEKLRVVTEGLRLIAQIPTLLNALFPHYKEMAPFLVGMLHEIAVEIADAEYSTPSRSGTMSSFKSGSGEIASTADTENENEVSIANLNANAGAKTVANLNMSQSNQDDVENEDRMSTASSNAVSLNENEVGTVSSELLNLEEALRSKLTRRTSLDEHISGARSVSLGKMRRKLLSGNTSGPKKQENKRAELLERRHDIVSNLLDLFKICPFLVYSFLKGSVVDSAFNYVEIDKKLSPLLKPVIDLLVVAKSDGRLVQKVESFASVFPVTITNNSPREAVVGYLASSILVDAVSQVSADFSIDQSDRGDLLRLLARLVGIIHKNYNVEGLATTKYSPAVRNYHESGGCRRHMRSLEIALFLGLFSNNVYTIRVSRKLMFAYLRILTSKYHYDSCFEHATVPFVESLLSTKLPIGKMAIRKKIRDRLCLLTEPTDLLLDVWNLMYDKLDSMSVASHGSEDFAMSTSSSSCYAQYVASLGGIILSPAFETDPRRPEMQEKLRSFLDYCIVSIFSNDREYRERCREALCMSVHPFLCGKLLLLLEKHLPRFYETLEMHRYVSCDLYIDVLRSVCQIDASEQLFLSTPSLWNINFELLKRLNFVSNDASFLRLKLKFCKLQVLFLSKFDELAMHGSIQNKNDYAKYAAQYMEDSYRSCSLIQKRNGHPTLNLLPFEDESKGAKLSQRELDELNELHAEIKVEVSKMLQMLFHRMPLDTPGHSAKDDRLAAKVVFSNYFNMFVRILEELNEYAEAKAAAKREADPGSNSSDQPRESQQQQQQQVQLHASLSSLALERILKAIVRHVIQALVNLLSSNSSIGLSYALPLGYHEDKLIRVSLINVFAKIVGDVVTHHKKLHSNREKMLQSLTGMLFEEGGQPLLFASIDMCPRSEVDSFANALLEVAASQGRSLSTLSTILETEIDRVADSVEILRSNTVATRMVALYSRSEAADYLVDTLHPVLQQMASEGVCFEIEKVNGFSDVEKKRNLDLFLKYLDLTVNAIISSVPKMPHGIRVISRAIFNATRVQFPQSTYVALGAYLFLRLYNPSIVSPDRVGVVSTNDPVFKRSVIQIARTIQIMVNAGDPSSKFSLLRNARSEQCLVRLSSRIIQFMDAVIDIRDLKEEPVEPAGTAGPTFFHIFFYDHWMAVRRRFVELSLAENSHTSVRDTCERIRRVDSLLADLGLPDRVQGYEIPDAIKNDRSERGMQLYDFMSQAAFKDVSHPWHGKGAMNVLVTRDGFPLTVVHLTEFIRSVDAMNSDEDAKNVALSANNCKMKAMSTDPTVNAAVYRLVRAASKYWEQPYCWLIDCTGFQEDPRFGVALSIYRRIVPDKYRFNCKRTYYFNISSKFFQQMKEMRHRIVKAAASKRNDVISLSYVPGPLTEVVFLSSESSQQEIHDAGLVSFTNGMAHDARVVFHDVSLYQKEAKRFVPMNLRIGNRFMQIIAGQPQQLKIGSKMHMVRTVDVYPVEALDHITASSYVGVFNELSITDSRTGDRLTLASPKRVEIMRTLYLSRARRGSESDEKVDSEDSEEENVSGDKSISHRRVGRNAVATIEREVGQLLNISLAGLLASYSNVRTASYSLLGAVVELFGLDVGRRVEPVHGVSFPPGEIHYVMFVSEQLSHTRPDYTYSVLSGFFAALERSEPFSKPFIVAYISPWVKNLYSHVFCSGNGGPVRAAQIVRRLVRASASASATSQMASANTMDTTGAAGAAFDTTTHAFADSNAATSGTGTSLSNDTVAQAFLRYVWPQLSLEDQLVVAVIDEIVAAALDREAEGYSLPAGYWPLAPTMEVCGVLLRRLRELSYVFHCDRPQIELHTAWVEATVLARFLARLVFDSRLFVDSFLADIFYVVTIFMDSGPAELRKCMFTLLVRSLHACMAMPEISPARRAQVRSLIEKLNGPKFQMLFAGAQDDDAEPTRDPMQATPENVVHSMVSHDSAVSRVCDMLVSFLRDFSCHDDSHLRLIQWTSYATNIAFDNKSTLQPQGVLVLGSLSCIGANDIVAVRLLGVASRVLTRCKSSVTFCRANANLLACTLHSLSRAVGGISPSSPFLPRMFWVTYIVAFLDNALCYKYGLQLMCSVIERMGEAGSEAMNDDDDDDDDGDGDDIEHDIEDDLDADLDADADATNIRRGKVEATTEKSKKEGAVEEQRSKGKNEDDEIFQPEHAKSVQTANTSTKLAQYLAKYRSFFGKLIPDFEKSMDITFSVPNFDAIMISLCAKGLTAPLCVATSMATMRKLLKRRFKDKSTGYIVYLFYAYVLSSSNEQLIDCLKHCGIPIDSDFFYPTLGASKTLIPSAAVYGYDIRSPNVIACCLSALQFFSSIRVDESTSSRAVLFLGTLQKEKPKDVLNMWSQLSAVLKRFIASSSTAYLLEMSLEILTNMMDTPEGQETLENDFAGSESSSTLEKFDLGGLTELDFSCKESAHGVITQNVLSQSGRSLDFVCKMFMKLQNATDDDDDDDDDDD